MQAFSDRHRLALRAALLRDERGRRAFTEWSALVALDDADDIEFRILPLIYRRLVERGEQPAEFNRFKGVYRHVWSSNTMLLRRCAAVVQLCEPARVETILLGGVAMTACWQETLGPRFVSGADILVRRRDARDAVRLLEQAGWIVEGIQFNRISDAGLDRRYGTRMRHRDGHELGLYWRALPQRAVLGLDELLWAASQPIDVMGATSRRLTREDHLYHTLVHGAARSNGADLDAVVDAVSLLQTDECGDWSPVLRHVERDRSWHAVSQQLELLRTEVGFETPLLREMSTVRVGVTESLRHAARRPVRRARTIAASMLRRLRRPSRAEPVRSQVRTPHLPDANQSLLLRAALVEGPVARRAWSDWYARTGWEAGRIDEASERILPLVYARLGRGDDSMAGVARLRALYRRTWYGNSRHRHLVKPAIAALQDAGHRVMLIKGVSLMLKYYADSGARAMGDVDLLVNDADAVAALDELLRHGWRSIEPDRTAHDVLARHHGVGLSHPSGGQIDLHRRLLADSPPNADGPLWDAAEQASLDGLSVLVPCAADELLLTCIHGWQWNPVPSIRWIHDAAIVVRHMQGDESWARLVAEARRRHLSFRLSCALGLLRERFDVDVPAKVLANLERGPFAPFEMAEERAHTSPPGLAPPALTRAYFMHQREVGMPGGIGWWIGCARRFWFMRNPPSGLRFFPWLAQWAGRRLRSAAAVRQSAADPQ
jgi:hypothetical protein